MDPNIRNIMNIMNQDFREPFGVLPLADSSFSTQRRILSEPRGQDLFGRHKDFREQFGSVTLADSCLTPTQRRMLSEPRGQDLFGRHKDFIEQFGFQDCLTGSTNQRVSLLPLADSSFPTQRRMLSEPRGQDLFGRHKDFKEQFGLQDSLTGSTNQRVSGTGTGLVMERSQNKVRSPTMGHLDPQFGLTSQDSSTGSTNQRVSGTGTGLVMERSQNKVRSPTMGHLDPQFGQTSQDSSTGSTNQRVSSPPLASSGESKADSPSPTQVKGQEPDAPPQRKMQSEPRAPLNHDNPGQELFGKLKGALERHLPLVLNPILSKLEQSSPPLASSGESKADPPPQRKMLSEPRGRDFFSRHQGALESRLPSVLHPILSLLQQREVLNAMERADVMSKPTSVERNFALLTMIQHKGATAQQVFYKVLKEADPYLVDNLEG